MKIMVWELILSLLMESMYLQNLLAQGADADSTGNDNESALHKAAEAGHVPVVEILLSAGEHPPLLLS